MNDAPFSRRTVVVLSVLGGLSLLVALFAGQMGGGGSTSGRTHPDSLDVGALGHRAFLEVLRRCDLSVKQTSWKTAEKLGDDTVLVLLEPDLRVSGAQQRLMEMLSVSQRTFLVLPKWRAVEHPAHDGWVGRVTLMPEDGVRQVLGAMASLDEGDIDSEDVMEMWLRGHPGLAVNRPEVAEHWRTGPVTATPELVHPQLVTGRGMTRLVTCDEGALAFEVRQDDRRLMVLTDPDVIATHGLGRGENAQLAVELVDLLAGPGDTLVVDETLHGRELTPGVWSALGRWPLVLLPIQGLIVVGVLLWAGLGRFGPPLPVAAALSAGKRTLIENTVGLLVSGGHAADLVRRYLKSTRERVAETYAVPGPADGDAQRERLAALSEGRGVEMPGVMADGHLARHADDKESARELIASAREIHRWREEMLHGAGRRPRAG